MKVWLFRDGCDVFHCFCRLPVFLQRFLLRSDLCVQICFRARACVCVSVYQFVSVLCCRTGENKSPAVVLISSSFVSVLRDQLSARCLPLQLHLLQTIITPFNASASQTAEPRPTTGSAGRQKRVFRTKLESELAVSFQIQQASDHWITTESKHFMSMNRPHVSSSQRERSDAKITEHESRVFSNSF